MKITDEVELSRRLFKISNDKKLAEKYPKSLKNSLKAANKGKSKDNNSFLEKKFNDFLQDTKSSKNFPSLSIEEFACAMVNFDSSIADK